MAKKTTKKAAPLKTQNASAKVEANGRFDRARALEELEKEASARAQACWDKIRPILEDANCSIQVEQVAERVQGGMVVKAGFFIAAH